MKNFFLFLPLLILCSSVISQQIHNKDYYLSKSKKQRTTGLILVGGGIVTSVIGLTQINLAGDIDGEVNNTAGTILFFTGAASSITGFAFLIASNKNKRRGRHATAGIGIENAYYVHHSKATRSPYPVLKVRFHF